MPENCPIYKQKLEDWRISLRQVEALRDKFQETGDLKLKNEFEKIKQELEANKKAFLDFAYEEIVTDDHIGKLRINFDVEQIAKNLELDENTPWETIEVLSKIPDMITDLTNIKQKYKDQIEHWEGGIADYSEEVSYPKLKRPKGGFYFNKAVKFSAKSLKSVGGGLKNPNKATSSSSKSP